MQVFWEILTGFDTTIILIVGGLGGKAALTLSKQMKAMKGFGARAGAKK